jgi:hypothetical protein
MAAAEAAAELVKAAKAAIAVQDPVLLLLQQRVWLQQHEQ